MEYLLWCAGILFAALLLARHIVAGSVIEDLDADPLVWIRLRSAIIVQRGKDHCVIDMMISGWSGWATIEVPMGHLVVRDQGRELLLTPWYAHRIAEDLAIDLERFGERIETSDPGTVHATD